MQAWGYSGDARTLPKTRVWGSEPENLHCSSATASLKIELRWGCEESSEKTAAGSGVSFKYDPFGRRIYKSSSSGTSVYAYDEDNLIEETNATGTVVARYEQTQNIDEPLAMLRSSATSYFHADGIGSITSLSNSAGTIANTYTYDSYGNLTASAGSVVNSFRYTARESDSETGLYFYRARYYDTSSGRFLSEDSLRLGSGVANFYSYVGDSPTSAADPLGLCKVIVRYDKPWGWLPGNHAYIVTVDPSGWMMGFRAGPDPDSDYIKGTAGTFDKYFPDFEPGAARNPESGKCNKMLDDDKPCTKINFLLMTALSNIDAGKIPYYFLGPNSNSVVPYALGFAGLPVPTPPAWTLGWGYDPFYNPLGQGAFSANPTGMQGLPRH